MRCLFSTTTAVLFGVLFPRLLWRNKKVPRLFWVPRLFLFVFVFGLMIKLDLFRQFGANLHTDAMSGKFDEDGDHPEIYQPERLQRYRSLLTKNRLPVHPYLTSVMYFIHELFIESIDSSLGPEDLLKFDSYGFERARKEVWKEKSVALTYYEIVKQVIGYIRVRFMKNNSDAQDVQYLQNSINYMTKHTGVKA